MNCSRTPKLSLQYVVRNQEEVDDLETRFAWFLKRCAILDRGSKPESVPVVLTRDAHANMVVNLDPSCEVQLTDMTDIKQVLHGIGEMIVTFKNDVSVRVKIGMITADSPEDAG